MGFFKTFIANKLPYFYKEYDTYKDQNGEGILTRFLHTTGEEIDINTIPNIEGLSVQKTAFDYTGNQEQTEERLLEYLANDLGSFVRGELSIIMYRKLLANIVDIYKYKGTLKSYSKLLYFYGYEILSFTLPTPILVRHDNDILHDPLGWGIVADFDFNNSTNLLGWYLYWDPVTPTGNLTVSGGMMYLDMLAATSNNRPIIRFDELHTIIGHNYELSFDYKVVNDTYIAGINIGGNWITHLETLTGTGTFTLQGESVDELGYLGIIIRGNAGDQSIYINNIRLVDLDADANETPGFHDHSCEYNACRDYMLELGEITGVEKTLMTTVEEIREVVKLIEPHNMYLRSVSGDDFP